MNLNAEQQEAFERLSYFLRHRTDSNFFKLSGFAGTGKTFMLNALCREFGANCFAFTATTNKSTKILRKNLSAFDARCKTIYSLLGIRMTQQEDRLMLEFPQRPAVLTQYVAVVVDEAGMVNKELLKYIMNISGMHIKWIFVGDPAQLPPIGEKKSGVWKFDGAFLTKVMRNDDYLLSFATHIRTHITKFPRSSPLVLASSHDKFGKGVWKFRNTKFLDTIENAASKGLFSEVDNTKAISWRNRNVDGLNGLIRRTIFKSEELRDSMYLVGDRIMVAEPVEMGKMILANIDDEGTVTKVTVGPHTYHTDITCYFITVKFDEGRAIELRVVHERSEDDLQYRLNVLAAEARADRSKWKNFWSLKNDFHRVRYSYAITAHRSQGSTYQNVFLDSEDILANSNSLEALQCLYVAATRPTTKLILK